MPSDPKPNGLGTTIRPVNKDATIIARRINLAMGQHITIESTPGSFGRNGERRSPKLCICVRDIDGYTSVMLTHDENFGMIEWYKNNDPEWEEKLKPKLQQILDDEGSPRWNE